jgi:hypothetical protein
MSDMPPLFAPRCRVVLDNDWSGDPDGVLALVHHLLSPTNQIVAITSSFLDPAHPGSTPTAADGTTIAQEVLTRVALPSAPPVYTGAERGFGTDAAPTAASAAMITEARRDDPLPLYLICGGPLTNVAAALRAAPDIAERCTLIWIGGSRDGAGDYNEHTDPAAAEFVFNQPRLDIIQFPAETYRLCVCSMAELESDLYDSGELGQWLWDRFFTDPPDWGQPGGTWVLGDSPPLLVTALSDQSSTSQPASNPAGTGVRTVVTAIDNRLIIADLMARLRLHHRRSRRRDNARSGSRD